MTEAPQSDTLLTPTPDDPTRAGPRMRSAKMRDRLVGIALPLFTFVLLIVVWQVLVRALEVPRYILPAPSEFIPRLFQELDLLWTHTLVTGNEIVLGFGLAVIVSIPLGFFLALYRPLERALYPLIVFFQLVPKIAIAPLLIVWFGFGLAPKILLTFMLSFFPTLVASMAGFKDLDPRVLYLTQSMGASRWQTFRYIRVPSALPFIFAGLRTSIAFATTAAIVAEFVGANAGLGYLLLRATSYLDMTLIFSVLVVLGAVGLALNYVVIAAERLLMPWKTKEGR